MLDKLVERGKTMAVLFYDPNDNQDLDIMDELEKIDDECRRFEIDFVKVRNSLSYIICELYFISYQYSIFTII